MSMKVNIDLTQEKHTTLTVGSGIKAAFVFVSTIALYYLAKVTEGLSYFGWRSNEVQNLGGRQILEVKDAKQSVALQKSMEKVERANILSSNQNRQINQADPFVEFEEIKIENLPERRSISVQNPIPDQNVFVGDYLHLNIGGSDFFSSSGATFLKTKNVPDWLAVSRLNPELKGSYFFGGFNTHDIAVSENYAYIAGVLDGLQIIDVSDPSKPTFAGSSSDYVVEIAVSGNYAYAVVGVFDGYYSLGMIYVGDPSNPAYISSCDLYKGRDLEISGDYVYVADGSGGLKIMRRVEDLQYSHIYFESSYETFGGESRGLSVYDNRVFIIGSSGDVGLQIVDVSDSLNPTFLGSYDIPNGAYRVGIYDNYAFVADRGIGLQIIDVSNPASPTLAGFYNSTGIAYDFVIHGDYAYVHVAYTELQVLDISGSPNNLKCIASYGISSLRGLAASEDYIYAIDDSSSLNIISPNLDKLTLSGMAMEPGVHSIDIEACNENRECVTNSFDIVVNRETEPDDLLPTNFTNIILMTSIIGAACAITTLGGVSVFYVIKFLKNSRKSDSNKLGSRDSFEIDEIVSDVTQNTPAEPSAPSEYDLNESGKGMPSAPVYAEEIEMEEVTDQTKPILSRIKEPEVPDYEEEREVIEIKSSDDDVEYREEPPEDFCCSISSELMEEPVITENGQTYDRRSIETWFADHSTDPLTGEELTSKKLIVNYAVKRQIVEWKEKNKL